MPHDCKVHCCHGHSEHGGDKDLSGQSMAGGAFAERHCRGPGQQPYGPGTNKTNQYGRIEHLHFIRAPAPQSFTWRHWLLHLLRESADLGSMPEVAVWTTGT